MDKENAGIYKMECCSGLKKIENLYFVAIRLELENGILSEISHI
jgi:hypothetical protein